MKIERTISVIGLGYVGLPVAVAMARKFKTVGFDINASRVSELLAGKDRTNEVSSDRLRNSKIQFSSDPAALKQADFHIIAVPTPVNDAKQPDLTAMLRASETVAKHLKRGDIIVYESTVYPGATEEDCLPVLEKVSGLKGGVDFKVGYSPERINPGDREHTFEKITKVVSGQDAESLEIIAAVYGAVIEAGVHRAESIKVAEAAKVIENTQRDLNIALMNELALVFDKMGIDTFSVLEAASTKWNFLRFSPGLVGGHCIGVDPYYLTNKAERMGYIPQVILAGRRINDGMGRFVAQKTIKEMIHAGHNIQGSTVTILGLTFKENCNDIRNTRVIDIAAELKEYGIAVQIADPLADPAEVTHEYGIRLTPFSELKSASAVVVAVAHNEFRALSPDRFRGLLRENGVLIDVKGAFRPTDFRPLGIRFWRM